MRYVAFLMLCVACAFPALAQGLVTSDNPLPPPVPFHVDSGPLVNAGAAEKTVFTDHVRVAGAGWLRLYFGDVALGEGSFIRITSVEDGEAQELDAATLAMWSDSSAYFNGDTVLVEVVAGPASENRLEIDALAYDEAPVESSLCGADDRFPTDIDWSGRVEPNGCSAAVWRTNSCIVSAGHCFDSPSDAQLIEFRVPLNNGSCQNQHPPVADQFPIIDDQWVDGGVGNDWAVGVVGPNNLGQLPFDRYGAVRPIALSVPPIGAPVTIVGYGVANECELSGTQQRSDGVITNLGGTDISHNSDTTGGNSGTGVVSNGEVIAVHTHAGCPSNRGTRIDLAAFAAARASLCIPEEGIVSFDRPAYGCNDTVVLRVEDGSLVGAGVQDVSVTSSTEIVPEIVQLNEAFAAVLGGTIQTSNAPVSSLDGLLGVAHGDTLSVTYADADDGGGASQNSEATASVDCLTPVISNVQVDVIDAATATVSWTTDEPASSTLVLEGPAGSTTLSDEDLVTDHGIQLTGLTGCFEYLFSVSSSDLARNEIVDDNGGSLYAFDAGCPPPPSVPNGTNGSDPMTVYRAATGSLRVFWDNQCASPGPTKIIFGPLSAVAGYEVSGALCDVPAENPHTVWQAAPAESIWFLIVKDNGLGVESSWGQATAGERNGSSSSGQCGVDAKDLTLPCE